MNLHLFGHLQGELLSNTARMAASALVAGLWQGLLLCAVTGAVLIAIPKSTAKLRFLVWIAVFCASVVMPFLHLASGVPVGQASAAAVPRWVFDARWSYLLAAVWVIAGAYRTSELLLQAMGLRILWKSSIPVANEALTALDVPLVVGRRKAEICTSSEVDRPSVIGFFSPRILIPEWLFPDLTATELNHIVLHELEHLRRRDDWMNLLQKVGLVLLPLNPALFWIDQRLSTERELACDDGVLERTKTPRSYAASLTSVAERRLGARRWTRMGALALAATGMLQRRSELGQRIESILGRRSPVNPVLAGGMAALLVAGVAGSAAWLARTPQLVTFGGDSRQNSRDAAGVPFARNVGFGPAQVMSGEGKVAAMGGFRNVSFHQTAKRAAGRIGAPVRRPVRVAAPPPAAFPRVSLRVATAENRQLVVLTSWGGSPVSRVVIAMPDGRVFVAPYAAVPTQAGWLIVKL